MHLVNDLKNLILRVLNDRCFERFIVLSVIELHNDKKRRGPVYRTS